MREKLPPFKLVTSSKWRSEVRFSRGVVNGSRVAWDLKLECGHDVTRYSMKRDLKPPTKARCRKCGVPK